MTEKILPAPDYPGCLAGRERHVLPEPDGSLRSPTWLEGLGQQRAYAAEVAERITHPSPWAMVRGLPVIARAAAAGVASPASPSAEPPELTGCRRLASSHRAWLRASRACPQGWGCRP